ncbi:hypothetical protein GCM10020254_00440 [Streptomyces goshikiensis]
MTVEDRFAEALASNTQNRTLTPGSFVRSTPHREFQFHALCPEPQIGILTGRHGAAQFRPQLRDHVRQLHGIVHRLSPETTHPTTYGCTSHHHASESTAVNQMAVQPKNAPDPDRTYPDESTHPADGPLPRRRPPSHRRNDSPPRSPGQVSDQLRRGAPAPGGPSTAPPLRPGRPDPFSA